MKTIACLGLLDLLQLPVGLDDDLADRLDRDLGRFRGRETFGQTLKDDPKKAVEIECRGGAADIILSVRTRRKSFYGRGEIVKYRSIIQVNICLTHSSPTQADHIKLFKPF